MGLFDGTPLERPVLCERCQRDIKECRCSPIDNEPNKQTLKIRLEKRKRGKVVTVVDGFECNAGQLQKTLAAVQARCGTGGSIQENSIEVQGDHTDRVPTLLQEMGYRISKQNSGVKKG